MIFFIIFMSLLSLVVGVVMKLQDEGALSVAMIAGAMEKLEDFIYPYFPLDTLWLLTFVYMLAACTLERAWSTQRRTQLAETVVANKKKKDTTSEFDGPFVKDILVTLLICIICTVLLVMSAYASERVPHRPYPERQCYIDPGEPTVTIRTLSAVRYNGQIQATLDTDCSDLVFGFTFFTPWGNEVTRYTSHVMKKPFTSKLCYIKIEITNPQNDTLQPGTYLLESVTHDNLPYSTHTLLEGGKRIPLGATLNTALTTKDHVPSSLVM